MTKKTIVLCLASLLLLASCSAATGGPGGAPVAADDTSADLATAADEGGTTEERFVSDLSAEITLRIADAPPALSNPNAWDGVLAPFAETYPEVRVHLSTTPLAEEDLQPGLLLTSAGQLFPPAEEAPALRDLTHLYTPDAFSALLPNAVTACLAEDGHYYAYPFAVRVSCMAVNRRLFEEAGALQYIDEETRSWSTEDFFLALTALQEAGHDTVLSLPCAEGTDGSGTRAFLLGLYGGSFATPARTGYEVRSENNLLAFEALAEYEAVTFAPEQTEEEITEAFLSGDLPMTCDWDLLRQLALGEEENTDFLAMHYPAGGGAVQLPGSLFCLAVPDTGDAAQQEAAEALLQYLTALPFPAKELLVPGAFFPAVRNQRGLYDDPVPKTAVTFAMHFVPHFGDDASLLPDIEKANAAWNRMLREIASGTEAEEALKNFDPG